MRAVVLVEGVSDRVAVETLAARHGRDLGAEGVAVVALRGAGNIRSALGRYGPQGLGVTLAGLCDAGEEEPSGAPSSRRGSARASAVPRWSGWASSSASRTWRTS